MFLNRTVQDEAQKVLDSGPVSGYGSVEVCRALERAAGLQQTTGILVSKILVLVLVSVNVLKEAVQVVQVI